MEKTLKRTRAPHFDASFFGHFFGYLQHGINLHSPFLPHEVFSLMYRLKLGLVCVLNG